MNKENVMFGVIGLLIGSIIGFMFANSLNRAGLETSATATTSALSANSNPELPPDHPPIGASDGQTQAGSIQQVTAAIEKAKAEPQSFEAQMTAGDLYYQIQRFEDAAKFYETASKLKPNDAEPLVKAGNAYFDAENYLEAEKWYTDALAKNPKDITARTDLGLTFYLREPRDIDRAIKEYKTSLAINPKHEVTLQNLVIAYREKGDAANLQKAVDELRAVNPNNPALQNR
ncbi:MAG: tetratricopeptide repeat protein [Pyrinomonadaceae bacterium]